MASQYEETGVRLRALNEATPGVDQYVRDLGRVVSANERAAQSAMAVSQAYASAASQFSVAASGFANQVKLTNEMSKQTGQAAQFNAGKFAQYSLAIGTISGQLQSAGIASGAAAKGLSLAGAAVAGFVGPAGLAAIAVGGLVTTLIDATQISKRYAEATAESADRMIAQLKVTGSQTDAERELLEMRRTAITVEQAQLEAKQKLLQTQGAELSLWQEIQFALLETATRTLLGVEATQRWVALHEKTNAELQETGEKLAIYRALLEDIETALAGGTTKIREQEEAVRKHAAELEASERRIQGYREAQMQASVDVAKAAAVTSGSLKQLFDSARAIKMAELAKLDQEYAAKLITLSDNAILTEAEKMAESEALHAAHAARKDQINAEFYERAREWLERYYAEEERLRAASERAAEREKARREAAQRKAGAKISEIFGTVGVAIGETAQKSTTAWREAFVELVKMAAREASAFLAIQAWKLKFINPLLAAGALAAIVAVNAIAAGFAEDLSRDMSRSPKSEENDYERARSSPDIQVQNRAAGQSPSNVHATFAPSLTIALSAGGQDATQAWRQSADEWLDQAMRRWMDHQRLKNGGRVLVA